MGGSSPSPASSQTVTQVQQIPQFEQDYAQQNQNIASSLASTPYPTYSGQLIAGLTPQQQQGMTQAQTASTAYQPDLSAAEGLTNQAGNNQWNAQTAQQYMSPYAMAALQPQIQALQNNEQLQNQQLGASATQAGAFGDARQGVAQGLNNFNNNLAMNDLTAQGMNTAYTTGQSAFNAQNANQLAAGGQLSNLGSQQQGLGEAGATANFNAGTQQQQLNQSQLTEAYNNFMNQVNWPTQGLNERISALGNSPYTTANYTSLAPSSATAQNLGSFASLAGGLGSLLGTSGSGSSSTGVFGGAYPTANTTSDRRLKKNIKHLGETKNKKIPVYEFHYLDDADDSPLRIGVMAQEVLSVIPAAVGTDNNGFYTVNYGMID